jgi:hypothetical protein
VTFSSLSELYNTLDETTYPWHVYQRVHIKLAPNIAILISPVFNFGWINLQLLVHIWQFNAAVNHVSYLLILGTNVYSCQ